MNVEILRKKILLKFLFLVVKQNIKCFKSKKIRRVHFPFKNLVILKLHDLLSDLNVSGWGYWLRKE